MTEKLKEKISESFSSVLPVTIIVLILGTVVVPIELGVVMMFMVGAGLLVVGMGIFTQGAEMAMTPIGESLGSQLTKINKLWLVVGCSFVIGFIITIAEPDLIVLAAQVSAIPNSILIYSVAIGVGLFLVLAVLRALHKWSLQKLLLLFYGVLFAVSVLVPKNFVALAFDSGGVTTGPITVPFILALGTGLASSRSDKGAKDDSFGLVAICSVGPILAVMLLGILYNPQDAGYSMAPKPDVTTMQDVLRVFAHEVPHYFAEVFSALLPICIFFVAFQLITRRFRKRQLMRMGVGIVYTIVGLVLFLTGANVGFIPLGSLLGSDLAANPTIKWFLIPIGMLVGYFLVSAEPAVHVLNKQVEEVSDGAISRSAMNVSLSIGVAVSVGLSMLRLLTGISIYWLLVPGYLIALGLSFKVPRIFVGIAFDSGGVASGPMTATFLLPLAMGACQALGGNIMTDAFGIVAMVAMTPLIAVQLMGLLSMRKPKVGIVPAPAELDALDEYVDLDHGDELDNTDPEFAGEEGNAQ